MLDLLWQFIVTNNKLLDSKASNKQLEQAITTKLNQLLLDNILSNKYMLTYRITLIY